MLDDFEDLKRRVAQMQKSKDMAEGAFRQIMSRLKQEFGVKSLKEAKKKLAELEAEERKAAVTYTKAKEEFERSMDGHSEE